MDQPQEMDQITLYISQDQTPGERTEQPNETDQPQEKDNPKMMDQITLHADEKGHLSCGTAPWREDAAAQDVSLKMMCPSGRWPFWTMALLDDVPFWMRCPSG
nr:hypothetical protein BaRGS_013168 [Batillaria attramentaria]